MGPASDTGIRDWLTLKMTKTGTRQGYGFPIQHQAHARALFYASDMSKRPGTV